MTFRAVKPIDGSSYGAEIAENTKSEIDSLIAHAAATSASLANQTPVQRAQLLRAIAATIESSRDSLIESACAETALPEARIAGEVTRTTVPLETAPRSITRTFSPALVSDNAEDAPTIPAPMTIASGFFM